MMDGPDAKAELPGDGQNRRDVARAIAMDVDADIAGENSRQRLQLQVARRHGACAGARLLDRALVAPGVQELLPHVSDDALPARRHLIVVDAATALGVLAAGHLEALHAAGRLPAPQDRNSVV